jgi:hypothetical protein
MHVKKRLSHLWRITRWGWFVGYEVMWLTIFVNVDLLIGKYGSERAKLTWERWSHPHFGWQGWAIGALLILCAFLWEGSFRSHRELEKVFEEKEKKFNDGRPKILIRYLGSRQLPGNTLTLEHIVFENLGGRSAHNVRIVPDKTKKFWLVQVGFMDTVIPGTSRQIEVRAMMRNDNGQEEKILGSNADPLRILAATMVISDLEPKIYFSVCYEEFNMSDILSTDYVFRLDNLQEPHFEIVATEP